MAYRPSAPFTVPMKLLVPTVTKVKGATKKEYPNPDLITSVFFGSFRTFGGTERVVNDVYTLEDTATVDTWYDPRFKAECRVHLVDSGEEYDIIGTPENIDRRNQFTRMRLKKVGGRA